MAQALCTLKWGVVLQGDLSYQRRSKLPYSPSVCIVETTFFSPRIVHLITIQKWFNFPVSFLKDLGAEMHRCFCLQSQRVSGAEARDVNPVCFQHLLVSGSVLCYELLSTTIYFSLFPTAEFSTMPCIASAGALVEYS